MAIILILGICFLFILLLILIYKFFDIQYCKSCGWESKSLTHKPLEQKNKPIYDNSGQIINTFNK
jgi:hypothetical protein